MLLTYQEAINSSESERWKRAIEDEKMSLEKNQPWVYVDKKETEANKILTGQWVFRIKANNKYKARLVIRGFEQEYGIDYTETYSPVININCLRILIALAANKGYVIKSFDIKTAFLHGELKEKIFMEVPEGYEQKDKVCLLKKALYGLKQAPLCWNTKFTNFLKSKGFNIIKAERCIFKNNT